MNGQGPPQKKTWKELEEQTEVIVENIKKELKIQEAILKEIKLNLK